MPEMDGMEATRRIRKLPDGNKVKIVAVTASAFAEQRSEMMAAGMDDYVRKPYRAAEIYNCLTKHLGVEYIYKDVEEITDLDSALTPEMLEGLSEDLLGELREALESLDYDRIEGVVQRIALQDKALQRKLDHLVQNYNYPAILQLLQKAD
jgi:CheY-like chemotaxis protein